MKFHPQSTIAHWYNQIIGRLRWWILHACSGSSIFLNTEVTVQMHKEYIFNQWHMFHGRDSVLRLDTFLPTIPEILSGSSSSSCDEELHFITASVTFGFNQPTYTDGCSMDVVPGAISAKWRGNITPLIYHSVKSSHVQWPMSQVHTCDGWGVTGDTFSVICDIALSHVRTCDMDHSTCDNCSWVIFISSSWIEISETCVLWLIIRLATWHSVPDIVSGFRGAREGSG